MKIRDLIYNKGGSVESPNEADDMCDNCVTPWKCNGPHLDFDGSQSRVDEVYSEHEEIPVPQYPRVATGFSTVVFDFDGTLAVRIWPDPGIGEPLREGLKMLRHYASSGYDIVIHTARPHEDALLLRDWVYKFTGVTCKVVCGKPSAGLYLDDLGFRPHYVKEIT